MPIDRWTLGVAVVRSRWMDLERDWQSVVIGATLICLIVVFEVQIPW